MALGRRYRKRAEREAELWATPKSDIPLTWFDSPTVSRAINVDVSGRPDRDWLDHVADGFLSGRAARLGLNVGCGHGYFERHMLERNLAERMHGFDISAGAVEEARKQAATAGLDDRASYFVADANRLDEAPLEDDYDLVVACMALHHFAELETCLDGLERRMKPGALLVANEFIGPTQFQWTDVQLDAVNRLLRCLPSDLRGDLRQGGEMKEEVTRPTVEFMEENFGFEAICSERIVPAIEERFDVLEVRGYGGTVLQLLFEAIMGNFRERELREHSVIVRMAVEYERALIQGGVLPNDNALIVARKRA